MSGGSYNYLYSRVADMAHEMGQRLMDDPPEGEAFEARQRFILHLRLVADAMRAVEWVDSGDYGPGDEVPAIRAVLDGIDPTVPR